jgi:hypothetical protein
MIRASRWAGICAMCIVLLTVLVGGCGGDDDGGSSQEIEGLRIEQAQYDVIFFCSAGKDDLAGAADPLGTVLTAVDNLIKAYREDPDATYKLARIARTGDKLGIREIGIRKLLEQSHRRLAKGCGPYGRDQARRLQQALSAS